MSGSRKVERQAAPPVEEDPNAAVVCGSPPCFMHELDPTYLGYLSQGEVSALLDALLAAEWGGAVPDEARSRAALRRHLEAPGDRPATEPPRSGLDRLAPMVREALPRIHNDALRRDLEEVIGALERGTPRRDSPRDES